MKGPRSSLSTLPENLSFDNGSTSNDAGIDSQLSWNTMQTSSQNRLPDYLMQSSDQYLQHVRHEGQIAEWSLGETSSASAQLQGDHNERKTEHTWTLLPGAALPIGELNYGPSNIVSLTNADLNSNSNQTTANRPFLLQNSSSSRLPQDLNMSSGFGDQEDNERRVVEHPTSYMSIGSSLNEQMPFGCGGYLMDESGQRPGCSLDGRRTSCKRKALEVHPGQSSGVGSSNYFQNAAQAANGSIGMPRPAGNDFVANDGSELANNPRLRLGDAGAVPTTPFSLTSSGNAAQSSRRNFRLRINGLHPQDPIPGNTFSTEDDFGNADVSSSQNSSIRNRYLDMIPPPAVESGTLRGQSVLLQAPSVRRNQQSRWSGSSSTRSGSSSAPPAISQERSPALYEEASRNIPRSISEHPMFVPTSETGNSPQNSVNWNMIGGNNNNAGNVASTSRAGPSRAASSTAPSWSHRGCPQYPRRLSEMVRRSLLLSSAGAGHGGQSSNHAVRSSFSTAQETALPSAPPDNHRHRASSSRSALLERHLDGALGLPFSMRALAAAGEGRSSMMSEQIRRVLDIMRRGEGLRFEDVMILDHSVLLGMADIHDRHRDMRLDVDNMSYEELLALEERIGDVCTGLSEVTIMSCLKQRKHINGRAEDQMVETEPCSICREEYKEDDDLGTLECGHDFHKDCIKQWLMQKNLCPICKTTGLNS